VVEGKLYDGATAHPHRVEVDVGPEGLFIFRTDGSVEEVATRLLKRVEGNPGAIRLARSDVQGWRLSIGIEAIAQIEPLLGRPEKYGRWVDRIGLIPALLGGIFATAAIAAVGFAAPGWIAPHVPEQWERNVGDAIVGDFGDRRCGDGHGQAALNSIVRRLEGKGKGRDEIRITALNVPMFNAAALPGGHIVVFRPAITETEDADALAGIVAHEIAHVRRRHVAEAMIREFGIGTLIRLFGGSVGANAQQLVALSYSREAEAEADRDAIQMLRRAGVSPLPTARLFEKLAKEEGDGLTYAAGYLDSHPASAARAREFARSHDPRVRYAPVLSEAQADALWNVCWNRPDKGPHAAD